MLVPGTQMHVVTFGFIAIEVLILFYLLIHRLARPGDATTSRDIILLLLLVVYNLTGGLLPDAGLPGSFFVQNSIAYATGFMTPCYFPYYVYKGFGLEKMWFHAHRGVFYFLAGPYLAFVVVFKITDNLDTAKYLLCLPIAYAVWVILTLVRAVRYQYSGQLGDRKSRIEITVMFLSITPWVGLPVIDFFNLGQVTEVSLTNTGFLLLFCLHLKRNVEQLRDEHLRLIASELQLSNWDEELEKQVEKRTRELEKTRRDERMLEKSKEYKLTNREQEIALWVCKGATQKQIGESLFIAERTVAKHIQNIFEKVRVRNRMELCVRLET